MKSLSLILTLFSLLIAVGHQSLYANQHKASSDSLSRKQQGIVAIASLTSLGKLDALELALANGLQAGMTISEIKEVLVHLYAYCGFPRSIRGLQTFMKVLEQRKQQGITDASGKQASPISSQLPKYDRGKKVLETLSGQSDTGSQRGYGAFSPEIDRFLKEHLFADLFERDVLTYAERELTTISVLSSLGGVEPMLQSHLGLTLRQGISENQLKHVFSIIEENIGKPQADASRAILHQVISTR
ncbi:carboxymuconolactone decarboxylase family protein [Siphonobacter sp. SORGH_AS_0500]|uniref:carboxymuconolactone decarboxylase family protein n=1 Tax=Siphonobacter sp. SORGH_AS_0500 TaxID=1864824 RepID=UPI00285774E6|nr:carboxymuconolactone decarboxylase family protein [Siphonobacter sp. SORGH_AS_0500]MDR6197120.1 4-carboxymuconolactone decarboxylase [Siphonobacter sp. SORGH_AS_0500]